MCKMKKLLTTLLLTPVLSLSAHAGSIDLGKMKCSELVSMAASDEESVTYMIFWMDGYLSGVSGDTTFDDDTITTFTENIIEKCAASPKANVLKTAKDVGLQ